MDLYVVLGVRQDATDSEIKRAYRRLARRFHPDINPGDREAAALFQQVLEAYETLIDRERRVRYDSGEAAAPAETRRSGFEGFDFSSRGPDYSATFGDLMAEVLMEHGARRPAAARGTRSAPGRAHLLCGELCRLRARAHGDEAGNLPQLPRRRRRAHGAGTVRPVPGSGRGAHRARPHGVLAQLQRLRRHRAAATASVPGVRRGGAGGTHRAGDHAPARGDCRRRARTAGGARATRARTAGRRATSM